MSWVESSRIAFRQGWLDREKQFREASERAMQGKPACIGCRYYGLGRCHRHAPLNVAPGDYCAEFESCIKVPA